MGHAFQWLRSLIYNGQLYLTMGLFAIFFAPWAILNRDGALIAIRTWSRWNRAAASLLLGLRCEIRGEIPTGAVLIAAKHQSFFDIIILLSELPRPRFVMKAELTRAPIFGWFAKRIGCVAVERGKRGAAIRKMLDDVARGQQDPGQLVIYPQGTRVAPGAEGEYKVGTGILYEQLALTCIPVACNVGVFWPRRGVYRKPGLAVVEFLPPIEPGLPMRAFMQRLEDEIEGASNELMAEAGFRTVAAPSDGTQ